MIIEALAKAELVGQLDAKITAVPIKSGDAAGRARITFDSGEEAQKKLSIDLLDKCFRAEYSPTQQIFGLQIGDAKQARGLPRFHQDRNKNQIRAYLSMSLTFERMGVEFHEVKVDVLRSHRSMYFRIPVSALKQIGGFKKP